MSIWLTNCGTALLPTEENDTPQIPSVPSDAHLLREGWKTCGEYRIGVDPREHLNDERKERLRSASRKAMETWNALLGFPLFVEVDMKLCTNRDINIKLDENPDRGFSLYGREFFDTWCGCSITVGENAISWQVVAHELGHCIGLDHSTSEESLMYEYANGGKITQEMLEVVANNSDPNLRGHTVSYVPSCYYE